MAEQFQGDDRRARPLLNRNRAITYMSVSGCVATAHYLMKCFATGSFVWTRPDDALLEMWFGFILPPLDVVYSVLALIVLHRLNNLRKLAGVEYEPTERDQRDP